MRPLAIIDVVGLSPDLLGPNTPHLNALVARGFQATLGAVLPAVTCSVQSSFLTGRLPRDHGIVGNGWYFRDRDEVLLWRQSNRLVQGEKLWQSLRRRKPDLKVAQLFWWFNMAVDAEITVTPRPSYCADGRKFPGIYTQPSSLRGDLERALGPFPLFEFWGPMAGIRSSQWIGACAEKIFEEQQPDLMLLYLPHLDYDLQRYGPADPRIAKAVAQIDAVVGRLVARLDQRGAKIVALSEYGIENVDTAIEPNRDLRRAGLLEVVPTPHVGELLDPAMSRAFAVADHQIAHIYTRSPADTAAARAVFSGDRRIDLILDAEGKRAHGLDHERSGDLVLVAKEGAWFAYPYWLDPEAAPDFAATVDIHKKPGYDPCELFLDPKKRGIKARIAWKLLKKALGFRTLMDVIPDQPSLVKGSHGRWPVKRERGPVLICSERNARIAHSEAVDLKSWLEDLYFSEG